MSCAGCVRRLFTIPCKRDTWVKNKTPPIAVYNSSFELTLETSERAVFSSTSSEGLSLINLRLLPL